VVIQGAHIEPHTLSCLTLARVGHRHLQQTAARMGNAFLELSQSKFLFRTSFLCSELLHVITFRVDGYVVLFTNTIKAVFDSVIPHLNAIRSENQGNILSEED
jgi:hypothetical protein